VPNGGSSNDFVPWPRQPPAVDAGYMSAFWKRNRGVNDGHKSRWHPSMVDAAGNVQRSVEDRVVPRAGLALEDKDWQEIDDLLATERPPACASPSEQSITEVVSSLAGLRAMLNSQVLPAGRVMNRVIDVWAVAHQVGPEVARPAESLLTSLVGRDLVSAGEVIETCEQIEATLAPMKGEADAKAAAGVGGRSPSQPTKTSTGSREGAQ
jgi:hypothetical protein